MAYQARTLQRQRGVRTQKMVGFTCETCHVEPTKQRLQLLLVFKPHIERDTNHEFLRTHQRLGPAHKRHQKLLQTCTMQNRAVGAVGVAFGIRFPTKNRLGGRTVLFFSLKRLKTEGATLEVFIYLTEPYNSLEL